MVQSLGLPRSHRHQCHDDHDHDHQENQRDHHKDDDDYYQGGDSDKKSEALAELQEGRAADAESPVVRFVMHEG